MSVLQQSDNSPGGDIPGCIYGLTQVCNERTVVLTNLVKEHKMNPTRRHRHETPLAPWERELYGLVDHEPEPYVDVVVQFTDGTVEQFRHVRGFKFKKGMLTFEGGYGDDVLYYVPNVKFWSNTYCEQ
jgi:hypothetical protein